MRCRIDKRILSFPRNQWFAKQNCVKYQIRSEERHNQWVCCCLTSNPDAWMDPFYIFFIVIREQNKPFSSLVTFRVMSLAINWTHRRLKAVNFDEFGQIFRLSVVISVGSLLWRRCHFVCHFRSMLLKVKPAQISFSMQKATKNKIKKWNEKNGRAWCALDWNVLTSGVSHIP